MAATKAEEYEAKPSFHQPTTGASPELQSGDGLVEQSQETHAMEKANIVDWDGPDDPKNPQNWAPRVKMIHVLLISGFTLYAYV